MADSMRRGGELPTITIAGRRYVNAELLRRLLGMPDLTFLDDAPAPAPPRRPARARYYRQQHDGAGDGR